MFINKVYVSSFGKLKDVSFDFVNGLNTIKENNGFGKTTLSVFIKSMFYGLDDNKKNLSENERKKYQPWGQNESFGGYLDFTINDKKYRIERYFGKKASEDVTKLYDLQTMKTYNRENIGEDLFHIDQKGFTATCFMSQTDFEKVDDDSIITKFNGLCENNTSNVFLDARSLLDKESKIYVMKGERGKLFDDKRQYNSICQEIDSTNESNFALTKLKDIEKNIKNDIDILTDRIRELEKQKDLSSKNELIKEKQEKYNKLLEIKNNCIATVEKTNKVLNNKPIDDKTYEKYCSIYEQYNNQLINENKKTATNNKNLILIFSFIITVLISLSLTVVGFVFNKILTFIGLSALCVFSFIFVLFFLKQKKAKKTDSTTNVVYNELLDFLFEYGIQDKNVDRFLILLNKIKDISKDNIFARQQLQEIEKQIQILEQDKDIFVKTEKINDYDDILNKINEYRQVLQQKNNELIDYRTRILSLEDKIDKIEDLEHKKQELASIIEEDTNRYNLIIKTIEILDKANENLKNRYREPLEMSFNNLVNNAVDNNITVKIDNDLKILIEEKGSLKEIDFYSKGYQDIIEICKRFALIEVLFANEKPFVILDDVFYNLDDEKLKKSLEVVKKFSNDLQIIYFVCHESRRA